MTEPIQVLTTYHTHPDDPTGPALYRLECWFLPQEIGYEVFKRLEQLALQMLSEYYPGDNYYDISGRGPTQ